MELREFEKMLRDVMKANPGQSPLALLAQNGISVPPEFAEAAQTLASRSEERSDLMPNPPSEQARWF